MVQIKIKIKEKIMNGPQHYASAEECMASAIEKRSPMLMDAAMVHALLANAAATAVTCGDLTYEEMDREAEKWRGALKDEMQEIVPATPIYDAMAGQPPAGPLVTCACTPGERCEWHQQHAEPLVTCGAEDSDPDNDGGPCGLPVGHGPEIPHDNGAGWAWRNDSDYAALAEQPSLVRPYAANL